MKRFDKAMVSDKLLEIMPLTTNTHLPTVGSDHCHLLMEMTTKTDNIFKYFRFLNCWVNQPDFIEVVQNCWNIPVQGNAMWIFHQKW